MGRGGLFVIIRHGKGFDSGYFHLARFTVTHRQQVKGGQLIGYVGRTGIKESPAHLHFELRYQKRRFNPFHHLRPYLLPPTGHTEIRKDKPEKKRGKRGRVSKLRRKRGRVSKLRRKRGRVATLRRKRGRAGKLRRPARQPRSKPAGVRSELAAPGKPKGKAARGKLAP